MKYLEKRKITYPKEIAQTKVSDVFDCLTLKKLAGLESFEISIENNERVVVESVWESIEQYERSDKHINRKLYSGMICQTITHGPR